MATFWTEEREQQVRDLWTANHSATVIANSLGDGVSRSAVLGKVHRMGLASRANAEQRQAAARARKAAADERMRRRREMVRAAMLSKRIEVSADPQFPPVQFGRVRFLDSSKFHCKYIMDEAPIEERMVCGEDLLPGDQAFCGYHHGLCWTKSPSRRTKEALLRKRSHNYRGMRNVAA